MDRIGFWNVRGLNRPNKQQEVKWFLSQNKISVFGLLETKIATHTLSRVTSIFSSYSICTNTSIHKGGRVWLLWDPSVVDMDIKLVQAQCIVVEMLDKRLNRSLMLTMVYAFNKLHERACLWDVLERYSTYSGAWLVCGDFNNVMYPNERLGAEVTVQEMGPFLNCARKCGLNDLATKGAFFTWNNKQLGAARVCSRIDRVLVNDKFLHVYPLALAHFLPEGLYDHCPCIIQLEMVDTLRATRFRYFNMWSFSPQFAEIVQTGWESDVVGTPMYRIVQKLKGLKKSLKAINRDQFSNVEGSAEVARKALTDLQLQLQLTPSDGALHELEKQLSATANLLSKAKVSFLRQRAKVKWVEEGDSNTSFFHSQIKARRMLNRVVSVNDVSGATHDTTAGIQDAFSDYFKSILGSSKSVKAVHRNTVRLGPVVKEVDWPRLTAVPTKEEVKLAMFDIKDDKAPGPDGYTSKFFKDAWLIIGDEVCLAIQDFFITGKLLKQVNATVLTLIPKVTNPTSVSEFRPIACCNAISKCISKILCNRVGLVLHEIISPTQSAFVKGRQIVENVLICQDLVKLYTRKHCSPRCLLKIDLRKAYDSVEWCFVEEMLSALNFPVHLVRLIMATVKSPWYSLALNGDCFGFFKGERGLRQGDPLSPLLFTICMEYLSRILLVVSQKKEFHFHPLCRKMALTHLCFADDLLLFSKGDPLSVKLLLRGFLTFSKASGLEMNASKSELYCNGVPGNDLSAILKFSGFKRGELPFKYLGVPISSTRLSVRECYVLSERICARIRSWGARKISYAGRLTLVKAVLNSLHTYWASMFLLPVTVMRKVIAVCRNYLWDGCEDYHRAPPIAWDTVCLDKKNGGLGIVHCIRWNLAALGKYTWWLANKKDHLWVKWVNHVYLKGVDWKAYKPSTTVSWAWKKICKVNSVMLAGYIGDQWNANGGQYTIKGGYQWLLGPQPKVSWAHSVWNRFNIPKWSFIAWLMRHERLQTLDRLVKFGVISDGLCFLCGLAKETGDHLFFDCNYSESCLILLEGCLGVKLTQGRWRNLNRCRGCTRFQKSVAAAALNGLIYHIWNQRNVCRVEAVVVHPRVVSKLVMEALMLRISGLNLKGLSRGDLSWLHHVRRI